MSLTCTCPCPIPERIPLFGAYQCRRCLRAILRYTHQLRMNP